MKKNVVLWMLLVGQVMVLQSQHKLTVRVKDVPDSMGKISVALYNDAEGFLKFDRVFLSESVAANKGDTKVVLEGVPNGNYAVALFYDKNGNDELDTNWMGIPKEKVAFSNAKMKLFGPPSFRECAFDIYQDKTIQIGL